jgi:hypothetical protein
MLEPSVIGLEERSFAPDGRPVEAFGTQKTRPGYKSLIGFVVNNKTPRPFFENADSKGLKVALLTSSETIAMPQEVIGEPEEQGLADLHGQAAAGAREDSFR